jgi:hypothetical protein
MTTNNPAHLSEEAFDDVLIGLGSPESAAHLATCELCRSRMDRFRANIQAFNQASLAWSEARPVQQKTATAYKPWFRFAMQTPLIAALAATILIAIGLPVWHSHRDSIKDQMSSPVVTTEDSPTQIEQDNELMRSVNSVISETEESPYHVYRLSERPHSGIMQEPESRNR